MKRKRKWKQWLCAMLALALLCTFPGTAFASQKPEWRYGDSIFVKVIAEETRTFSPEDFPGINCKKVFILSKYREESESDIAYTLVLMLDQNTKLNEAIEKVKQIPMVEEAKENKEYVMKDTILTLNRSYLYLPVGGNESVWVKKVNWGRNEYSIYGIRFGIDPVYSEQICIEKDCFAEYGISCFGPEVQLESGDFILYPFIQKELESQKSESGMYHGLAGDENEYLFDAVARLAAAPEITYVSIIREFIVGEGFYNPVKIRRSLEVGADRIGIKNQYDDIWSMDNREIVDYGMAGETSKTLTVHGLAPGVTTLTWERCEGDMYALNSIPVIVYEPGSKNNPGDMDHDGAVSTDDVLQILKHSAGLVSLDEKDKQAADLNQDKIVDTDDALLLLKIVVNNL